MKTNWLLLTVWPTQAPAPATLRITDRSKGRVEPPRARGHAFQLTAEEARTSLYVVVGMFISFMLLIVFVLCLCVCVGLVSKSITILVST